MVPCASQCLVAPACIPRDCSLGPVSPHSGGCHEWLWQQAMGWPTASVFGLHVLRDESAGQRLHADLHPVAFHPRSCSSTRPRRVTTCWPCPGPAAHPQRAEAPPPPQRRPLQQTSCCPGQTSRVSHNKPSQCFHVAYMRCVR